MTAPTTDTTQVRWRGKGWRRRKDSLQTSWRADHTPWNNPLMKDITCNSQEPVWNAASQGEGTTVRGAGDLKVDQSEWLCELYACVSKSTCILFSSTTGPCCLSLTIVAWTTFLKAASCSNNLKNVLVPVTSWNWFLSTVLSHLALGDENAPECVESHRGAMARLTEPALQVKHRYARAEKLWDVMQQHQPVPQGHDRDLLQVVVLHGNLKHSTRSSGWIWLSFFFFKYIFICTTLMPSTGSWNLIFLPQFLP